MFFLENEHNSMVSQAFGELIFTTVWKTIIISAMRLSFSQIALFSH
jgi:hypothetical protein